MRKQKQAAIEAIARHFSATWEKGEDPPDAYLMFARKRIAIEVATIKQRLAALEDIIRRCLARRSAALEAPVEAQDRVHENQIRVRVVKGGSRRASKVIGFVHNPDSDPEALLDMTQALIEGLGAKSGEGGPARSTRNRWLVLAGEHLPSYIDTYRQVYSQLSIPTRFKKILMVLARGQVETLTG
jgi:hypothetical protein